MILPNLSHFETRTKRCCTFQINFFWCWLSWKGRIGWFLNPQHLFIFDSKWLKFGRIIAEHNIWSYAETPGIFDFKKDKLLKTEGAREWCYIFLLKCMNFALKQALSTVARDGSNQCFRSPSLSLPIRRQAYFT